MPLLVFVSLASPRTPGPAADRLATHCGGRNDGGQLGNGKTTPSDAVHATPSIVVGQEPIR